MMKSTQRVMEMYNYHCSAILCSSDQSILHFWACQISYGKCTLKHIANARALAIWFYSVKTSPNGHDEINTTSDGKEQLSLPGHPVFIRPVNFAFLQDFWACQISYVIWPTKKILMHNLKKYIKKYDNKIGQKYIHTVLTHV